jgi:uncharacterized membrane protein YhaH (DUF805 family)
MGYWKTIISEIFDVEEGLFKTAKDLGRKPDLVLASYLKKERIYTSPVRLFISVYGVIFVVISFLINWKGFAENILVTGFTALARYLNFYPSNPEILRFSIGFLGDFFETVMSSYFVFYLLLQVLVQNLVVSRRLKGKGSSVDFLRYSYANLYAKTYSGIHFLIVLPLFAWSVLLLNPKYDPIRLLLILGACFIVLYLYAASVRKSGYALDANDFFPHNMEVKEASNSTRHQVFIYNLLLFLIPLAGYGAYALHEALP